YVRMSRFWRDGILRSQRGFVGSARTAAEHGASPEGGLLDKPLQPEPTDAEIWNRLGMVLVRQGETARGVEAFRKALQLDPDHPEAHGQLAAVLSDHGRSADAAAHYERFLHLTDPSRNGARPQAAEILERKRSDGNQPAERGSWMLLGRMLVNDGVISE